jgi:hypothetical protein
MSIFFHFVKPYLWAKAIPQPWISIVAFGLVLALFIFLLWKDGA